MMEIPDELFNRLENLTANLEGDARELEAFQNRIDGFANSFAGRLSQATVVAQGVSHVLTDAGGIVETKLVEIVDPAIKTAGDAIQSVDKLLRNLSGAYEGVEQICEEIEQIRKDLPSRFENLIEPLGEDLGGLIPVLDNAEIKVQSLLDVHVQELNSVSTKIDQAIEENLLGPLQTEAERLVGEWQTLLDETVDTLLIDMFAQANAQIREPLEEALDQIADIVRAEFEDLRQELTGGDVEGQAQREALSACMDTLDAAFEPLKAAFDGFRSLASTVGIST